MHSWQAYLQAACVCRPSRWNCLAMLKATLHSHLLQVSQCGA